MTARNGLRVVPNQGATARMTDADLMPHEIEQMKIALANGNRSAARAIAHRANNPTTKKGR